MDLIYDAAAKFLVLEQFEYHFVVSQRRKLQTINLNFIDTDFFHIAGLHYLTDIVIPQDRTKTKVKESDITRQVLYINPNYKKESC